MLFLTKQVQESKGLEFDDVLLYNFFTNSDAGDLWRVISNYTERDIAEYYSDTLVSSSGVQRFEWDNLVENSARHLDFSPEKHKILEIEFKMLYTAITRARVNIFIAESDSNLCCK
jgi:ATP-dependent exoDNAse (exonuclease V) beta subunit